MSSSLFSSISFLFSLFVLLFRTPHRVFSSVSSIPPFYSTQFHYSIYPSLNSVFVHFFSHYFSSFTLSLPPLFALLFLSPCFPFSLLPFLSPFLFMSYVFILLFFSLRLSFPHQFTPLLFSRFTIPSSSYPRLFSALPLLYLHPLLFSSFSLLSLHPPILFPSLFLLITIPSSSYPPLSSSRDRLPVLLLSLPPSFLFFLSSPFPSAAT